MMDVPEAEGKQFKKLGKCRSRLNKVDFPLDCGMEVDGDQNGQGTPLSSREEKVSSLRTVSIFFALLDNFDIELLICSCICATVQVCYVI